MARKRSRIKPGRKFRTVMREFSHGGLKSSSGRRVKSRKQAIAIAFSEQRKAKRRKK